MVDWNRFSINREIRKRTTKIDRLFDRKVEKVKVEKKLYFFFCWNKYIFSYSSFYRWNRIQSPQEIDPCDPTALTRLSHTKSQQQSASSVENKTQGKNKASKGKVKRKKAQEDDGRRKAVRKLWYEALSPEGYTYYWHIETNGTYIYIYIYTRCFVRSFASNYFSNYSSFEKKK